MKINLDKLKNRYFIKTYFKSFCTIILAGFIMITYIYYMELKSYNDLIKKNEMKRIYNMKNLVIKDINMIFSDIVYLNSIIKIDIKTAKKLIKSKDYYEYSVIKEKTGHTILRNKMDIKTDNFNEILSLKNNMISGTNYFFFIDYSEKGVEIPKIKAGIIEDDKLQIMLVFSMEKISSHYNEDLAMYYRNVFLEDNGRYTSINKFKIEKETEKELKVIKGFGLEREKGQIKYKRGILSYISLYPFKDTVLNRKYNISYDWKIISYVPKASIERILDDEKRNKKIAIISITIAASIIAYLIASMMFNKKMDEIKLKEAKNKAEEANKAKSRFIANMSHEIRTPMNGIIGFTDILMSKNVDEEMKEILSLIQISGNNLMEIIMNILDISKIESGKMKVSELQFNTNKLINETIELYISEARNKENEILVFIGENIPEFLVGDYVKIQQILSNLISNAIKFTKKGKIEIEFLVKEENIENIIIELKVKDNGIGIASERQDEILNNFTQKEDVMLIENKKIGLGLEIVKKLLNLMNGKISLISEEGKGSEFFIELLLKKIKY